MIYTKKIRIIVPPLLANQESAHFHHKSSNQKPQNLPMNNKPKPKKIFRLTNPKCTNLPNQETPQTKPTYLR